MSNCQIKRKIRLENDENRWAQRGVQAIRHRFPSKSCNNTLSLELFRPSPNNFNIRILPLHSTVYSVCVLLLAGKTNDDIHFILHIFRLFLLLISSALPPPTTHQDGIYSQPTKKERKSMNTHAQLLSMPRSRSLRLTTL